MCAFEPKDVYSSAELKVGTSIANVLQGKKMTRGRPDSPRRRPMDLSQDPVFEYVLQAVDEIAGELANDPFESAPPQSFDWPRFFRLQMAYLLLWSAIEQFSAFAYGPSLDPGARLKAFGTDPQFIAAFGRQSCSLIQEVSDSRDPGARTRLDKDRPDKAAEFYYQVRSNLSHRGKELGRMVK
jgi:hypothetical protein